MSTPHARTGRCAPEISVIVPARNEAASLAGLIPEVVAELAGRTLEIVVVDDGSDDATPEILAALSAANPTVRSLRHATPQGKSAALFSAALIAAGDVLVTLDGDGQNDPSFIPALLERLRDPAVGLVAGQRVRRQSSVAKKIGSRLANGVRRTILGDATRDSACGIKAIRREAFLALPYFENMHRFLPALILADGWRVAHVDVVDRPRRHGRSHYGNIDRLAVGIPDLLGVAWLVRRRRRRPRFYSEGQRNDLCESLAGDRLPGPSFVLGADGGAVDRQ